MSATILPEDHVWGHICRLLGDLHPESLEQAMTQVWQCTIDTFEKRLATSAAFLVSVRLDYIKRVYGSGEPHKEETLLRDVLTGITGPPGMSTPRVMLNLAHNLNKQKKCDEAQELAQKVFSLLTEDEMYVNRDTERVECWKIMSWSQYHQGNFPEAELAMRRAIKMVAAQRGAHHPWVLEFRTVLEGWFRERGQEVDANMVQQETEKLSRIEESDIHKSW